MTTDVSQIASGRIEEIQTLAYQAGRRILTLYAPGIEVWLKSDGSPVTRGDIEADRILVDGLNRLTPTIPIISEESYREDAYHPLERFWLIDPLDGTRNFIDQGGEFTVNISLIEGGRPVLGMIYAPVDERLYTAIRGKGATTRSKDGVEKPLRVRSPSPSGYSVVLSRADQRQTKALISSKYRIGAYQVVGSSLKMCRIAEGRADLYPRLPGTWEWDTAAGDILIEEAGGSVRSLDGVPLQYGKPDLRNPAFIATADPLFPASLSK